MKSVVFVAPVLTQSGYGIHARQITKWLLTKKNIDLKISPVMWGDTPWLLKRDSYDGLIGKIMEKTVSKESIADADVTLQLQLPNEWNPNLGKLNIGITAGVETNVCNPDWLKCCDAMTHIVVPSQFSKRTFEQTGKIKTKISVVPEAYPEALKNSSNITPLNLSLKAENNFLIVAQITGNNPFSDRKNTFFAIKWICETFADRSDVGIVLKTNIGRNTAIDKKAVTNLVDQLLKEVRGNKQFPKIHLLHGSMSDEEMNSLYRHPKIKALVSLTRGEGYGLPLLEAAVTGLPVIATNWSGHLDFLNKGKFISIDHKLEEIHPSRVDGKIFVQGAQWASPFEEEFKRKAKKFIESQSVPQGWAHELAPRLIQEYSQEAINGYLDNEIGEYLC